jgi:predicted transcriptional regulator
MISNENRLYHEYLIRLDDDLSTKLVHFSKENDMKITGVVRRSLKQFFQNEEYNEKTETVKMNDERNER